MDIQSEFDFIKAAEKDIAMLTATRIQVLRAAKWAGSFRGYVCR